MKNLSGLSIALILGLSNISTYSLTQSVNEIFLAQQSSIESIVDDFEDEIK